jgi:hypothetical protein
MMRGAFGGFVILGLMALGEQAMNKHRLKQEIELKNFVREYQIQRELRQLKESYPGNWGLIETDSENSMFCLTINWKL